MVNYGLAKTTNEWRRAAGGRGGKKKRKREIEREREIERDTERDTCMHRRVCLRGVCMHEFLWSLCV